MKFVDILGDLNPLHIDPEAAEKLKFKWDFYTFLYFKKIISTLH